VSNVNALLPIDNLEEIKNFGLKNLKIFQFGVFFFLEGHVHRLYDAGGSFTYSNKSFQLRAGGKIALKNLITPRLLPVSLQLPPSGPSNFLPTSLQPSSIPPSLLPVSFHPPSSF
jgi:hypothetical protein